MKRTANRQIKIRMKKLNDYKEDIYKCTKCGLCQAVCPVFKETGLETTVSRGKFTILNGIINGHLKFNKKIAKTLEYCLGCNACYDFCPSGISVAKILSVARYESSKINGFGAMKTLILFNFKSNFMLRLLRYALIFYKKTGLIYLVNLFSKIPSKLANPLKIFNYQLQEYTQYKRLSPAKPISTLKIAYYPGCINDYINPSIKNAVIMVLEKNGITLEISNKFSCCGIASKVAGDFEGFVELATNNINQIPDDIDYFVTDCASCGSAWELYPEFLEGKLKEKAEKIAKKSLNINQLLLKIDLHLPENAKINKTVTYHDPCHLKRFQNVSDEPRQILKNIPGLNYIEMENADECCGAAGSFCVTQPEISQAISDKKALNIKNTKADIITTSCAGCKIGIAQGLTAQNHLIPIYHPIELLAQLYLSEELTETGNRQSS